MVKLKRFLLNFRHYQRWRSILQSSYHRVCLSLQKINEQIKQTPVKPKLRLRFSHFNIILVFTVALLIFAIVVYSLPHKIPIEGNLVVEQLGFITAEEQPFFSRASIKEIKIVGKQKYTFDGFEGDFDSKKLQQIKKFSRLIVSLEDSDSSLTVTPIEANQHLKISEWIFLANTKVRQLRYEPIPSLSFYLSQPETSSNESTKPLILQIGVPVKVSIQGNHKIEGIQQKQDDSEVTVQAIGKSELRLPSEAELQILPSDLDQSISFFGNHSVSQLSFLQDERILDYESYEYSRSTIVSGTLRVANQTVTIEKDQFLKLGAKNDLQDIENLPYIRIVHDEVSKLQTVDQSIQLAEPVHGLEVGISGRTNRLEIGINPNLPIKTIQGTYLNQLSSESINILLIIFTSLLSGLLTWLLSNLPQTSNQTGDTQVQQDQ